MTSTVTKPAAIPQHRSSDVASDRRVTARDWFALGARRPYDPIAKIMLQTPAGEDLVKPLHVFEKAVAVYVAGSEEDPFEPRQIVAARERLAPLGVDIQWFPGGHLTTFEHADLLADAIRGLARTHGVGQPIPTNPQRQKEKP